MHIQYAMQSKTDEMQQKKLFITIQQTARYDKEEGVLSRGVCIPMYSMVRPSLSI